jgi:hypothetical protein
MLGFDSFLVGYLSDTHKTFAKPIYPFILRSGYETDGWAKALREGMKGRVQKSTKNSQALDIFGNLRI